MKKLLLFILAIAIVSFVFADSKTSIVLDVPEEVNHGDILLIEAKLENSFGQPINNANLRIYNNDKLLDTLLTENDGIVYYSLDTSTISENRIMIFAVYDIENVFDKKYVKIKKSIEKQRKFTKISDNVKLIEQCSPSYYKWKQDVFDVCKIEEFMILDDKNETLIRSRPCFIGYEEVRRVREYCFTEGYQIFDNEYKTPKYKCTITQRTNEVEMVCDSTRDGNGDGICSSGESCQKLIINPQGHERFEKNSKDKFVNSEKEYFLTRIEVKK